MKATVSESLSLILAAVVVLVMWLVVVLPGGPLWAATRAPRFTVGQTYMVVWECLPIPNGQPCYVEELTVKAVYHDGWIDVIDEGEVRATGKTSLYTANPARMLAFSLKPASRQAVIEHGPVYRMPVIVAR